MENLKEISLDFLFAKVSRLHHTRVDNLFNKHGLYRGQPPILRLLWEKDGCTQKQIAERLRLKPATITDTLQRMEKSNLVERMTDTEDLRISRVYLTDKGRAVQMEVESTFKIIEEDTFKDFTFEEKILLRRFFIQMYENLSSVIDEENPC